MPSTNDSQPPRGGRPHRHLYLLPAATPLPAVVPLLRPDLAVTPAQDALLTGLARRARVGDRAARDLLWRAFAPKLEPAVRRCRRMAWGGGWTRRDGRPWELDDLRQEAWLIFAELAEGWNGEGSFVPYVMAYFPWRLRNAMRRLGPGRGRIVPGRGGAPRESGELQDAEVALLLAQVAAALEPADALLLDLHLCQGIALSEIAARSGMSRRTIARRWEHVRRVAQRILGGPCRLSREWR